MWSASSAAVMSAISSATPPGFVASSLASDASSVSGIVSVLSGAECSAVPVVHAVDAIACGGNAGGAVSWPGHAGPTGAVVTCVVLQAAKNTTEDGEVARMRSSLRSRSVSAGL